VILKRYNDFKELHTILNKLYNNNCPTIPGKSFFKVTALDELNKRKDHLETFLKECVLNKGIMNNEHFRNFIEVLFKLIELFRLIHILQNSLDTIPLRFQS